MFRLRTKALPAVVFGSVFVVVSANFASLSGTDRLELSH
jgi:hypothetical protein